MLCQITAVTAAQNICSALFARERTGRGQHVEVAMLDSALFFMWPEIFGNYTFMGDDAPEPVPEGECCTWLLLPANACVQSACLVVCTSNLRRVLTVGCAERRKEPRGVHQADGRRLHHHHARPSRRVGGRPQV